MRVAFPAILSVLLVSGGGFAAEPAARAPCGADPVPAYASVGAPPNRVSRDAKTVIDAPCASELGTAFRTLVALSGSFRFQGDTAQLLERLGAASKMKGIRYWSTSDSKWTELILSSHALEKPGSAARSDFTSGEMTTGKELYYAQKDNRSAGEVTYRMRITARGRDEITAQIQNVTPVRYSVLGVLVTAYEPGDVRTVHFLKRRSADVWDYYLVTATRQSPKGTNERSLVNRAAAVYRYVAGQRTDEEPPLAP